MLTTVIRAPVCVWATATKPGIDTTGCGVWDRSGRPMGSGDPKQPSEGPRRGKTTIGLVATIAMMDSPREAELAD